MSNTAPQVKTWLHSMKGRVTGVVVSEDETWLNVKLSTDHVLKSAKPGRGPFDMAAGTIIGLRKTRLTEITGQP
jgi:hypothetical protein